MNIHVIRFYTSHIYLNNTYKRYTIQSFEHNLKIQHYLFTIFEHQVYDIKIEIHNIFTS